LWTDKLGNALPLDSHNPLFKSLIVVADCFQLHQIFRFYCSYYAAVILHSNYATAHITINNSLKGVNNITPHTAISHASSYTYMNSTDIVYNYDTALQQISQANQLRSSYYSHWTSATASY